MRKIYLDSNATTSVAPEVVAAMMPFFTEHWGNPSTGHASNRQVAVEMECSRAQVARLIGAETSEIVFTSCGTESNNTAIWGAVEAAGRKLNLITTRVEHAAVLGPCRRLARQGHRLIELGVDTDGQLDLDQLRAALALGPALVSIMTANNETGVLFPIPEIAELVHESGSFMHTDAVQAVGKVPVDLRRTPVHMLSLSGHKLHAPKGIGVLYVRRGVKLSALLLGGKQEGGRRGGTENVPYIVGLGTACELALARMEAQTRWIGALRDRLEQGILAACPTAVANGGRTNRLPNTSNIAFPGVDPIELLRRLGNRGIVVAAGAACTPASSGPSHVIAAMSQRRAAAGASIRFSLSRDNTEQDIDFTLDQVTLRDNRRDSSRPRSKHI